MAGYKYNGSHTGPDSFDLPPKKPRREPPPCGTTKAYNRHISLKEQPCGPCTEAHQAKLEPCGTPAAARRHERNKEKVCDPCHAARAGYRAKLPKKKRQEVKP